MTGPLAIESTDALVEHHFTKQHARKRLSYYWDELKITWQDVVSDLAGGQWKAPLTAFAGLAVLGGLATALVLLVRLSQIDYAYEVLNGGQACGPGGKFSPYLEDEWEFWVVKDFFEITLKFGDFSFSTAKMIDVAWDIVSGFGTPFYRFLQAKYLFFKVVGRGGQTVLAWVSWHTFADFTITSLATKPSTYATFWIIFLQREISLHNIYLLIRDCAFSKPLSSRLAAAFIITTLIFILSFPTLAGSATGYTPKLAAFLTQKDGNLLPYSQVQFLAYIVRDGRRINQTDNYHVPFIDPTC